MAERPTLRDIAQLAGVSLGTASQALNNKGNVAPDTRQRVLNAAARLGYQQQVRIPTVEKHQISTVGALLKLDPDDSLPLNPSYSAILAGAERECQRQSLSLMFANVEVDLNSRVIRWPTMLLDQQVDGLLIMGIYLESTLNQIDRQLGSKPIVLLDAYAPNQSYDMVVFDNFNGAFKGISHLIECGHRHIGLIGSHIDHDYPSVRERREGYLHALKVHGIQQSYIPETLLRNQEAFDGTIKLLREHPEITAIFACNDETASSVLRAVRQMGLRVPDDVSVMGFDDVELAQNVTPALTTMRVDRLLVGALGVRQLVDRALNPDRPALMTSVSTEVVVRESVGPPPMVKR